MNEENLLKQLGFTEYEIKVYMAVVHNGTSTAHVIAEKSGVPANKVYSSLLQLIKKGFVAELSLRPKKYKITNIQPFKEMLSAKEKEVKELHKSVSLFKEIIMQKQHDLQDIALVLKGKRKIIQMLTEASEYAEQFGYSFVGDLYFDYMSAKSVAHAIKKGVEFRFLIHKNINDKRQAIALKQWKNVGVKIKYYPKNEQKSIRFSTFDNKVCRITIGSPEIINEDDYLSFWIESPAFASLLKDQFLDMWKKATDK